MGNPIGFLNTGRETAIDRDPSLRIKDFKEIPKELQDSKLKNQAGRCMDCGVPFCISGCPLGNLIPDFNDHVYSNQWDEAIRALYATNNFPEITGRVCPAPCESSCVLGIIDPPVTIKQIERAISRKAESWGYLEPLTPLTRTGKKVAIVGSGPCGLACAQQLNRAGHQVEVFEKTSQAGGLVTWGIPAYKMPKDLVAKRVAVLKEEGITFIFSTIVGKDISWQQLEAEYDALVICIGAEKPRDLDVEGRSGGGIHYAMEFLHQQSADMIGVPIWPHTPKISAAGKDVIVIGGGDTGADCIGTSLRQGAKSVRNFELMPCPPSTRSKDNPWPEYNHSYKPSTSAIENIVHGGGIEFATATSGFELDTKGNVKKVITKNLKWQQENGKWASQIKDDSDKAWSAQLVLLALGYLGPYSSGITEQLGLKVDQRGNLVPQKKRGIFVAGDCRRGQSLVVWAIAEGREMAAQVDEYLMNGKTQLSRCDLKGGI